MDGNAGVLFSSAGNEGKDLEWARRHMVGCDCFEPAGLTILAGRGFRKGRPGERIDGGRREPRTRAQILAWYRSFGEHIDIGDDEASGGFSALPGTIDNRPTVLGQGRRMF